MYPRFVIMNRFPLVIAAILLCTKLELRFAVSLESQMGWFDAYSCDLTF